jgi:Ca-activated chloride channel family protein
VPREVVLLVDHSGSMEGAKWQAADWAVERFLSGLTGRDACALGLFHNTTRWFARTPRPADADTVAGATAFLREHRDSGGTELGVALEQALGLERAPGEMARHVLVITDAQVTDAGRILRLADEESGRPDRRRISLLCLDAAPNALLAHDLAERGGGVARFLTSAPDEEDITTALDEVLADWAEPVLSGLRLEVNRPGVEAAGRGAIDAGEAGWSAVDLGDLPAGRPVWVAGRVPRGEGDLVFRVRTARKHEVASCRLDPAREADARPALKALFGARRVRALEGLMHAGYRDEEVQDQLRRLGIDPAGAAGKAYAENARAGVRSALQKLLVREALDYGLASAATAFVAVRTEPGKPVDETVVVANALPAGWSERFIGGAGGYGGAAMALKCDARGPAAYYYSARLSLSDSSLPSGSLKRQAGRALSALAAPAAPAPASKAVVLFAGVPTFTGGEAVLFDSAASQGAGRLPDQATLEALEVRFPDGTPAAEGLDPGLCVLVFVDDLASPRARARLTDVVRQRGERPLNLRQRPGQAVRLVLIDPAGAWGQGAPRLEVALRWAETT